jgi:hypothetical protein
MKNQVKVTNKMMMVNFEFPITVGQVSLNAIGQAYVHKDRESGLIEGDFEKFQDLVKTSYNYKNVIPVHATVEASGAKCLDEILINTSIPIDFDVLSIDIDSFDYQVWQGINKFFPKIVVIEINSSFPPSERYVYGDGCQSGSSFRSMLELGQSKGYTFVCHTGNMIFVRNDLVSKIQNEVPSPPESGFLWNWVAR